MLKPPPRSPDERITRLERASRLHSFASLFHSAILAIIFVVIVFLLGRTATPQDLTTPAQALDWAVAHQLRLPAEVRPNIRYLWIPPWGKTDSWAAATSFALNTVSHNGVVIRPQQVGTGWMLAVNLQAYAPEPEQLGKFIATWDKLSIVEPYFHILQDRVVEKRVQSGTDRRGNKQYRTESSTTQVAVIAPHVEATHARLLAQSQASPSLVYRVDWFLTRVLDLEYYDFAQFGDTLDDVLKTIGASIELAEQVEGDQRVAIFISGVTGKPRRIDRIQGAAGRSNTGAVFITNDIFDESVDIPSHPIYSLLKFELDGREIIAEKPNGFHMFVLTDAAGNLVRVAPPNLVSDNTIPAPNTQQLRPAISCIRCHGPEEGMQPAPNDVLQMVLSGEIDVIDDFGDLTRTPEENVDRLAGLYMGDFTRRLALARDDYSLAVRRATMLATKPEGLTVPEASKLVSDIYGGYLYSRVDASQACRELGYEPGEDPRAKLKEILPHLPPNEAGIIKEDPTIAALRSGLSVRRADWETVYHVARLQVARRERNDSPPNPTRSRPDY